MSIYCTYITFYRGNKLPPFYIGSTSVAKIANGYHGSVKSERYRIIWETELRENASLFETKIISLHSDRNEAFKKEEKLQRHLSVIKNSLYVNRAYANKSLSEMNYERMKYDNPMSKLRVNRGSYKKGVPGRKWTLEDKAKAREFKLGNLNPNFGKTGSWNHLNLSTYVCIHCGLASTKGNIVRWHNDKCKKKSIS